jgi:diguanylate cyclase (GGDEF)-like protein/PAS domain S-box-containing protein
MKPDCQDSAPRIEHDLQRRMQVLLDASHEAGTGIDDAGFITDWNRQAELLFGWRREEIFGESLALILIPSRFHASHYAGMAHFLATGEGQVLDRRMEVQALHRNGSELTLEMTITALPPGGRSTFLAFMRGLSNTVATERALTELAMQDALTGLSNCRAFMTHLDAAMARARRSGRLLALLYLDIDHFKSINDNLGHAMGDSLLSLFSVRLKAHVREIDLVSRLGGDEFTVILEALQSRADAEIVAAKLVQIMTERFDIPALTVRVSISLGLAFYEGGDMSTDHLISLADQAMYQAKRSGRNTWRTHNDEVEAIARVPHTLTGFIARSPGEASRERFLNDAVAVIRTHLGMDVAFISEFTGGYRMFRHVDAADPNPPLHVDQGDPLADSYCQRVVDGRLPELILDAFDYPAAMELPATRLLPVRGHLSVPITLPDGRVYGTLCCFSYTPDTTLNARDLNLMRVFADLAARHIEYHDAVPKLLETKTDRPPNG